MSGGEEMHDLTAAVRAMYRVSFSAFAELTPRLLGEGSDWQVHWSSRLAALHVERCLGRDGGRLVVNAPPYAEALEFISVAIPVWLIGRWPDIRVSCVSRSPGHAALRFAQIHRVLDHPFYRGLFPSTSVKPRRRALLTPMGGCVSTTVVGQYPGDSASCGSVKAGCDVLIIDTPDAPECKAHAHQLAKTVAWYETVAEPALQSREHSCVILLTPRMHQSDLSAYLMREPTCAGLKLPSFATEEERLPAELGGHVVRLLGDVLQPDSHPQEVLRSAFKDLGKQAFEALHQQRPPDPAESNSLTGLPDLGEKLEEMLEMTGFDGLCDGEQSR